MRPHWLKMAHALRFGLVRLLYAMEADRELADALARETDDPHRVLVSGFGAVFESLGEYELAGKVAEIIEGLPDGMHPRDEYGEASPINRAERSVWVWHQVFSQYLGARCAEEKDARVHVRLAVIANLYLEESDFNVEQKEERCH